MSNTWGSKIKLSIFGESHGEGLGVVIDGLPAGTELDRTFIETEMLRRAPGRGELSTPRKETDSVQILSGLFNNKTTGAPLCGFIKNTNTISKDYNPSIMRPSHADYTALIKYNGFSDYRGGGHFSGRLTAPIVFAGAIAKKILISQNIEIAARIFSVGNVKDESGDVSELLKIKDKDFPTFSGQSADKMKAEILKAKQEGDSVGGIIECGIFGLPVGLGEPFFGSMESVISAMMFSIPAVKGIEFGAGFEIAKMNGSRANDQLSLENEKISFTTNNNGGINGGITNGEPIIFRVAIKPTPTISKEQNTVDIAAMENVKVSYKGRHDPCIVPRAVVVIEGAAALCILDSLA